MKKFKLFVLALAGLGIAGVVADAPSAKAQGYYDDGYRPAGHRHYDQGYYDRYTYRPKHRRPKYDSCRALIRASGVGNIIPAIARVNAIKAWQREARAVYGKNFSWRAAKANSINCEPYGVSTRCTAKARPCY